MYRLLVVGALMCATLFAGGCLRQDTRHTLYLSPDGSVVWSVLQKDVRSDEKTAAARAAEEQAFENDVNLGTHSVAQAFRELGADQIATRWTRRERPLGVLTDGQFGAIDELARQMLARLGIPGSVFLDRDRSRTTLTIEVRCADLESEGGSGQESVMALVEELSRYRIVLTQGRFEAAVGFNIVEDDVAAPLETDRCPCRSEDSITWSLTWSDQHAGQ